MHLCFVVEGYPTKDDPFMTFIRELAVQMTQKGVKCSVIAPQSLTRAFTHKLPVRPVAWKDSVGNGLYIDIYQPYYITLSKAAQSVARASLIHAARKAFKMIKTPVDALYGHFWHMGVAASKVDKKLPVFVACGESKIEVFDDYTAEDIEKLKSRLAGVVYVGTKSYVEANALGLQGDNPYIIAPNGFNSAEFYKMDKSECRKELGFNLDDFIISFVGSFNKRKGVDRLSHVLSSIEAPIYSCFIGSGDLEPDCGNILHKGKAAHNMIAKYINASDIFVLPTNNEGCCNAIVEALGCGIPVISSNQQFNDDILDESCSIRIDPMNESELRDAIEKLMNDTSLREKLAQGAMKKSEALSIEKRAERIIGFIGENIR